jgi:hypothetical protein
VRVLIPGLHFQPLYLTKISFGYTSFPPNFLAPSILPGAVDLFLVLDAYNLVAKPLLTRLFKSIINLRNYLKTKIKIRMIRTTRVIPIKINCIFLAY